MRRYRYIVLALGLLIAGSAQAQEVVTDELIYNRVTGYMEEGEESTAKAKVKSKNIQEIRFKHDVRITYGAIGFISGYFLDMISFGCDCGMPPMYSTPIEPLRTKESPKYVAATFGLSYSQQLKPWLAVGCKTTFSTSVQRVYDTYTNEKLYNNNIYNVAALADARFSYLRRDKVELYSSVAIGLMAHIERANGGVTPMFDVALFGISVGRSFYGFAEIGAGIGGSARVGLGFRFNGKK